MVPGRTTVYNFEVADYHTYYVAGAKVLVHNNPGPCDFKPGVPKKINNVQQNKATGDAYRDKVLKEKQAEWGDEYEVKPEQRSNVVDRTHDISVYPKGSDKAIQHYEVKTGKSRYKTSQRIKDDIIEVKTGAKTTLIRGQ